MFHSSRLCVFCVLDTWGLTCGSAGETQAAGLWGRREPAERWRPLNPGPPGPPGSLPQAALHPLACRYFPKRADLKPFSSVPNGINTQGKLIMHRTDWVFAFINDNFKLDEAQIGQFKKRLMGSYCHFSEKMHRASIFQKSYCKKKKKMFFVQKSRLSCCKCRSRNSRLILNILFLYKLSFKDHWVWFIINPFITLRSWFFLCDLC